MLDKEQLGGGARKKGYTLAKKKEGASSHRASDRSGMQSHGFLAISNSKKKSSHSKTPKHSSRN